eukprot:755982-Rhodomonas_salina.3
MSFALNSAICSGDASQCTVLQVVPSARAMQYSSYRNPCGSRTQVNTAHRIAGGKDEIGGDALM